MSDEEQLVAERVVPIEQSGPLTVRISQHAAEEFWRVDVSREAAAGAGHMTTTVAPGDNFMMNLIEGAVSGEPVAWSHLAHWGQDALGRTARPVGPRFI
jgi:hypothetical protein